VRPQQYRTRDGRPACEFCRKPIVWAFPVAARGTKAEANPKPMPLNFEPSESPQALRTLYREAPTERWPNGRPRTGLLKAAQAVAYRAAGNKTYVQHFKTCVKKDQWGKAGKSYGSRDVSK
jgi:hypothetical protein